MAKERALTLEALRVMDAIDRRGSFAAAADELGRVPSALSYTMQKLEEELDVVLFAEATDAELDAILARDAERASALMREHLLTPIPIIQQAMAGKLSLS